MDLERKVIVVKWAVARALLFAYKKQTFVMEGP
ncbi:Putative protein [Zobellia galactanivorans]|uniref:Uncharacterized protein n=1 Tax=Zobellia galactanivorans (strain DSM 12802 / CCUG 47099 / CIP 106680 / NCIMB 13871 / Dsij) TaxID=63186 RepID=G0LBL0_ZOBGA|nr:Putative protein [Zobellia galactanivorans]